MLSDK